MATYPGGKNGAGVFQTIINLMPPHKTYIEAFLGSGAVIALKRPAAVNIGIDIDLSAIIKAPFPSMAPGRAAVIASLDAASSGRMSGDRQPSAAAMHPDGPQFHFLHGDATRLLYAIGGFLDSSCLIYCDPPYLRSTRKSAKALYRFEFTDAQHDELLAVLRSLPCMVLISGYWSKFYADRLPGWNTRSFIAGTRRGPATEWVWFNFPDPIALHDYRYVGATFRDRERIKRKQLRWTRRLAAMSVLERRSLLAAISDPSVIGLP